MMRLKKNTLLILLVLLAKTMSAQTIQRKVVSAAGGYYDGAAYKVSYTLGETFINTYSSSSNIVNQGFQQPDTLAGNLNGTFTIGAATTLLCGSADITPNNFVDVPITINSFNNMMGLQGTIKWDSTLLEYQSISSFAPGIGLSSSNFNSPAANTLIYSWVDGNLTGQSLPDLAVLFTIRFVPATAAWGRSSAITFENTPATLEAIRQPASLLSVITQAGGVSISARPVYDTILLSGCGSMLYNGVNYTNSTTINTALPNTLGCDSIFRTAFITIIPVPVISAVSANSPLLIGDNLQLTVSGQNLSGGTFAWTGPNGFSSALQNPILIASVTSMGQYRHIYNNTCRRDTQYVPVTVNTGISGRIVSPLNQPISRVNLLRNNLPELVSSNYSIAVSPSSSLVLKVAKNNDANKLNGVSVIDIVLIQNHILQLGLLNSPYKLIAADVNRSGNISTLDIVLMKRLILGLDTTFPGNILWAFADSNYVFPNTANPFPYKDSINFTPATLQSNKINQTFIGMKLGDVNYDWNYQQQRPVPAEDIVLFHDDVEAASTEVRIPVKVKNLKDLLGMQFTLQYNSNTMRFRGVERNRLNLRYGNSHSSEGLLSFIWNDDNNMPVSLSDDEVLMELVFDKTSEFIREDLALVNSIATVEAWDKNYRKHNVVKGKGGIFSQSVTKDWSVSPNPSTGKIVVEINLTQPKTIELYLTTLDGRVLSSWKQNMPAGKTAWSLDMSAGGHLPAGVYCLKLPGFETTVKKVVIVR